MFTFAIFNNGREVDNLDAGTYPTEALARDAGLVAIDDLCPLGSPNRGTYRVEVRAARMSKDTEGPGFTPGPYFSDKSSEGYTVMGNDPNGRAFNIAHLPGEYNEQRHNAKLFEAAPDLYHACELAYEALSMDKDLDWVVRIVEAALSRAKGGV